VLNRSSKGDCFQIMIYVYVSSTWSIVELVTRFETWITRNDVNDVSLFYVRYLKTLMAFLCSQWKPNIQIIYFIFEWSIYRLFVLNRGWKRDSLQIMIFVYNDILRHELKKFFGTWITRNDLNGVSLFHLCYLIILMVYMCSQWT
jgi:hypothetical protein